MPELGWESLRARLRASWKPGEHVTIVGPTRSGKTHIALELAEMCAHIMVLATKRSDPLVTALQARGYLVTGDTRQIAWAHTRSGRRPVHNRVVYWPTFPGEWPSAKRRAAQAAAMRHAMDWANQTGGWALVLDESLWLSKSLRLDKEMEELWFQGRTQGLSVIANVQRPAHVPRLAFSSADYLFLGQTSDGRDIENLREISAGIPRQTIEDSLASLDFNRHEFLFVDTHRKELARVVAPPRP